jgi:hypothetical protein
MKAVIALGMLTLAVSAVSRADQLPPNDPQIKTGGPLAAASSLSALVSPSAPAGIITPTFTVESPSGTSPVTLPGGSPCILIQGPFMTTSPNCYFQNDMTTNGVGDTITSLTFDAFGVNPSSVECGFLTGSPFSSCTVEAISGGTAVDFTGGSIVYGQDFTLAFVGFPKDFSFGSSATVTPEPGTLVLLLAGVGALVMRRRRA